MGFIENQYLQYNGGNASKAYADGYAVGPEWSPLILNAGDKRQVELAIMQGARFGNTARDFHQAVTFTYLFLD